MNYRLWRDTTMEAHLDALPEAARLQLTLALFDVIEDPVNQTEPWGIDDGRHRILLRPLVTARLSVNHEKRTLHMYGIELRD
ncbi:hypothetical protein [Streptomyces chilikensis]|uniref:Uncharacterized protein n=1 Tax=Streptomyces chilikensis TaxID=1194079 RepID=A0ABV3ERM9_9ACTN